MTDVSAIANPSNLSAETRKKVDNGTGNTELLQEADKADFVAVSGTPTQAQVEAIRDACIAAGIMKAS